MQLSDSVDRKFIESINLDEWEIETDTGWQDITHIHQTVEYDVWSLVTESGLTLSCADDHILFDHTLTQIFSKDLIPNYTRIMTKNGPELVTSLIKHTHSENMYDLTVDSSDHRYYTNGILSHNTTVAVCIILHYVIFNDTVKVALLANKADAAREILERIKVAYEALPDWLQHGINKWNEGSIKLENKAEIRASATTASSIRGKSCNLLYIDECAFVPNWDEFAASVLPTISSGNTTKLLYTSTPNGLNHYYKICSGAKEGTNGFDYKEVSWREVPGRDEKWRKNALEELNGDTQKFAQEYEIQFLGSSGTLISGETLKALRHIEPTRRNDDILQYELPIAGRSYAAVCDVSRGKGLDYSAVQVIDITEMPYKQVCTFRSNIITPIDFSSTVNTIRKIYNDALVMVEINDIGAQVADSLYHDYECENLIHTETAGASGRRMTGKQATNKGKSSVERGVRTTISVKRTGCSILKLLVEQQQLILNDKNTIEELYRFSAKGNTYAAEEGCHDDLVMGLVLFAWMSDQEYFRDLTDIATLSVARDRTDDEIEGIMSLFGFHDNGAPEHFDGLVDLDETPERYQEFIGF